jgi:predicted unusual protein kinase regulating ubiquinone biosynthesis (AarF/ABC1/UbiB family)
MADDTDDRSLRDEMAARLLASGGALPTSAFGRLGRTASIAVRARRLLGRLDGGAASDADVDRIGELVASLGALKGVAMKMGQILSYIDVAAPDELRQALSALQTHSPPMPLAQVVAQIEAELGDRAGALLAGLEPVPVAAASIGQVHRATLPDGRRVAVKVRYPEIDRAIASDFRPAALGGRLAALIYPGARVDGMIAEARTRFLLECDYRHEAAMQRRFGALYAGHPVIVIPAVEDALSAERVLTTGWIDGLGLDGFLAAGPDQATRDRLGEALFEFYLGTLFRHGLYNCDPHPGNYLFLPGGRIALLDHGCARDFEPAFVARLARLARAVHADDRAALEASFLELGMVKPGQRYDFAAARDLVRGFHGSLLRDEHAPVDLGEARSMRQVMGSKRALMKLALPGEFLFLFRIRFGLLSVLARLGARARWRQLEERYLAAAPA